MVGDSLSDMDFGEKSGVITIFISNNLNNDLNTGDIDFKFKDLFSIYSEIIRIK